MSQIRRIGARRLGRGTSTCRRGCCVATVSPPMAASREACETDNEYPRKAVERREIVHLSSYFVKQVVPIEPSGTWLEGDDRACRVQFPKLIVFVAVVVNQARDQEETCRTQEEPKKSGDRGAVELKTSWDNDRGRLLSCIQPPGARSVLSRGGGRSNCRRMSRSRLRVESWLRMRVDVTMARNSMLTGPSVESKGATEGKGCPLDIAPGPSGKDALPHVEAIT